MIELLSPVGDFECLKAAVQNGADTVYFGANSFNARAFASNFNDLDLKSAITYAKIRGIKTNLTLNTLLKNDELNDAISLVEKAYSYGIDAIIVQDLGLAHYLIKNFPDLPIHASTQLSVHNLNGVLELQKIGFSRVVLSRELSLEEIDYICKNSNIEIEVFVHGALCVSYSGQCLFSSMIGGRSGNRGKCAQPCRLPYELISHNSNTKLDTAIDTGYLLSTRDLCGLNYLPQLIKSGVSCLKIEGRMKAPEYVATVTRIYRKYLDLAISSPEKNYTISNNDKLDLLQVFNRGGFSAGHLPNVPNKNLIYQEKPNNMGIFLGKISNFNSNKGHISFTTSSNLRIGDKIQIENGEKKSSIYTISELMKKNVNITQASNGDYITIGRMKGNIKTGNKIYKINDKLLTSNSLSSINNENRKKLLYCKIIIKKDTPIKFTIYDNNISVSIISDSIPETASNCPITKDRIITQISKTSDTPFSFEKIDVLLDDNLYINISVINEIRRKGLYEFEQKLIKSFNRTIEPPYSKPVLVKDTSCLNFTKPKNSKEKISILLNLLNINFDYTNLIDIDNIYIPFKYFLLNKYSKTLKTITSKFNTYIYLPTIIRNNYNSLISSNLQSILDNYNISGFVISNIGDFELLKKYNNLKFICNYTFNIYNNLTINNLNCNTLTLSPELNRSDIQIIYQLNSTSNNKSKIELIVYGRTPLMNSNYCLLGKSNKCYNNCKHLCKSNSKFYLKDKLNFKFRIIPDNIDTVTTIYNSKITSISHEDLYVDSVRIDCLDEDIDTLNHIIKIVKSGNKLEGIDYTNGNFCRNV